MKVIGREPQGSVLLGLFINSLENQNKNIELIRSTDNTKAYSR